MPTPGFALIQDFRVTKQNKKTENYRKNIYMKYKVINYKTKRAYNLRI
jgi:hypothetical protein